MRSIARKSPWTPAAWPATRRETGKARRPTESPDPRSRLPQKTAGTRKATDPNTRTTAPRAARSAAIEARVPLTATARPVRYARQGDRSHEPPHACSRRGLFHPRLLGAGLQSVFLRERRQRIAPEDP